MNVMLMYIYVKLAGMKNMLTVMNGTEYVIKGIAKMKCAMHNCSVFVHSAAGVSPAAGYAIVC